VRDAVDDDGVKNVVATDAFVGAVPCALGLLLGSMTDKLDLLNNLRHEWRWIGRRPSAREALRRLDQRHGDLDLHGAHDLRDVVDLLESRSGRSVLQRAQIVRALLEEATDPDIHRALLQTLLPGVVSVCRQLRFGEGVIEEPSEMLGVAISLLSELLVDWAGQSRPYAAPDILSALRGRLRRWMLKEKEALQNVARDEHAEYAAADASPLLTRLEGLRADHGRLVRLTYARVFEGRSLRELAADDHSAPAALHSELQHFAVRFLL
jgi:hypothetical protein